MHPLLADTWEVAVTLSGKMLLSLGLQTEMLYCVLSVS